MRFSPSVTLGLFSVALSAQAVPVKLLDGEVPVDSLPDSRPFIGNATNVEGLIRPLDGNATTSFTVTSSPTSTARARSFGRRGRRGLFSPGLEPHLGPGIGIFDPATSGPVQRATDSAKPFVNDADEKRVIPILNGRPFLGPGPVVPPGGFNLTDKRSLKFGGHINITELPIAEDKRQIGEIDGHPFFGVGPEIPTQDLNETRKRLAPIEIDGPVNCAGHPISEVPTKRGIELPEPFHELGPDVPDLPNLHIDTKRNIPVLEGHPLLGLGPEIPSITDSFPSAKRAIPTPPIPTPVDLTTVLDDSGRYLHRERDINIPMVNGHPFFGLGPEIPPSDLRPTATAKRADPSPINFATVTPLCLSDELCGGSLPKLPLDKVEGRNVKREDTDDDPTIIDPSGFPLRLPDELGPELPPKNTKRIVFENGTFPFPPEPFQGDGPRVFPLAAET